MILDLINYSLDQNNLEYSIEEIDSQLLKLNIKNKKFIVYYNDIASSGSGRNTTKVLRTNYPRHNDNDSDNTGGANDQVTWSYEWATGDFNTTGITDLSGGCIVDRATAATSGVNAKLLTTFNFASAFEKTASDTLKIFVNHTFEGA